MISRAKNVPLHCFIFFSLTLIVFNAFAEETLWNKLQSEPGMIVLMRNTQSSGNLDGANMLAWDASGQCKGESTLTSSGKAHAQKIGAAFASHGIKPVVISSPMCRCTETAQIAFKDYITHPDLRQRSDEDLNEQDDFQAITTRLLTKHRGKTPIVFINHRPNIDALTLELLDIGDLLIGSITETGEITVVGKIMIKP